MEGIHDCERVVSPVVSKRQLGLVHKFHDATQAVSELFSRLRVRVTVFVPLAKDWRAFNRDVPQA